MIKLIVAHTLNRVIGYNNSMPWKIKEELAFFKAETSGHSIIMGRHTFDSIGRVLPNRHTYVLTRDVNYHYDHENVTVINDYKSIIEEYRSSDKHLYICGGMRVYEQLYTYADELIISYINQEYLGDAYFVNIDYGNYQEIKSITFPEFEVKRYTKILG